MILSLALTPVAARALGLWTVLSGAPPLTRIYVSGSAAVETVPYGYAQLQIAAQGGGGAGVGGDLSSARGGGGSGGCAVKTLALTAADWGKTFVYTVGPGGAGQVEYVAGHAGSPSTVAAGTDPQSVSLTGGPGGGASASGVGAAGAASGGSVNTSGNPGAAPTGLNGGQGGAAVACVGAGAGPGGAGALAGPGLSGGAGQVVFKYS